MNIPAIFLDEILIEACQAKPGDRLLARFRENVALIANRAPNMTIRLIDEKYTELVEMAKQSPEPDVARWIRTVDEMVREENDLI